MSRKEKLFNWIFAIAMAAGIASSGSAFASITMGETSKHLSADTNNANILIAQSATLSQAATLKSLSIYAMQADGSLYLGVYDASGPGGGPGNLLATTASFTPATGWNTQNVTAPITLEPGTYWLAYLPSDNDFYSAGGISGSSTGVYYSRSFGSLPTTFSTSPQSTSYHWSLYATLDTQFTIGETTAHSSSDNGNNGVLIAQSAILSQSGTINSLSIYALTAAGNLRMGIYDDTGPGGNPGQLMAATESFTPTTGWNTVNVTAPIALPAGTYWLAYLPTDNGFTTAYAIDSSSNGVYYYQGNTTLPSVFSGSPSTTDYHWSFYANMTVSGAPSFTLGEVPFAASSSWNTQVPSTGVTYTTVSWPASTGYNYSVSWDAYSAAIYVASPTDPLVAVTYPAGWGYPGGTVYVRMPAAADGAPGTDGELLVIDGMKVHNFWIFDRTSSTTATASSYGRTDLFAGTGWGSPSPFFGAGITAAGSSQLAGILVQAETDAGEILHALNIRGDSVLVAPDPVGEAIASDGGAVGGILQEGQRYAIPYSTTMPSGLSPLGQKVFRALQKYGAYVTDVSTGVTTLGAQQNAYDETSMTDLWHDCGELIPLLKKVAW